MDMTLLRDPHAEEIFSVAETASIGVSSKDEKRNPTFTSSLHRLVIDGHTSPVLLALLGVLYGVLTAQEGQQDS